VNNEKNKNKDYTHPVWVALFLIVLAALIPSPKANSQDMKVTANLLETYASLKEAKDIPQLRNALVPAALDAVILFSETNGEVLALTTLSCGTGLGAFLVGSGGKVNIGCYISRGGTVEVYLADGKHLSVHSNALEMTRLGFRLGVYGWGE
jgi:hypothetical protein